jgi:hypothetical protein
MRRASIYDIDGDKLAAGFEANVLRPSVSPEECRAETATYRQQ